MDTDHIEKTQTGENLRLNAGLKVTVPAPRDVWQQILDTDLYALVDQSPAWIDALVSTGKYEDASHLFEISGERLIMPMVRYQSKISGLWYEASLPLSRGMGGLIGENPVREEQIRAIFEHLTRHNMLRTSIRPNPLLGSLWERAVPRRVTRISRLAHVLDLEGGFEEIWAKKFTSYTRTKVRKAEKSGLVVECDTTGRLIPAFFNLLEQSVARWAEKQHEPALMARLRARNRDRIETLELIAKQMGEKCNVWMAWYQNEPTASIIVLKGPNSHSIRGAMNKELAGPTEANTLIQSMAIEDACKSGCRYYHLGESGSNQSLAHFKERFGAVGLPYAEYFIERLPLTAMDRWLRGLVKKVIGFKDA